MPERVDLNVPYAEKDEAKALGARWDPSRKTWYVPQGQDPLTFQRWLPQTDDAEGIELLPEVFSVESRSACWKCGEKTTVAALASESYVDHAESSVRHGPYLFLFSNLRDVPDAVLAALTAINPGFRRDHSQTAGVAYLMNHCHCGAKLGDFYMHSEPGGAFFPMTPEDAQRIRLHRLSSSSRLLIDGSPRAVVPNLILEYATRTSA